MVFFSVQKLISLISSHLFSFFFALGVRSKIYCGCCQDQHCGKVKKVGYRWIIFSPVKNVMSSYASYFDLVNFYIKSDMRFLFFYNFFIFSIITGLQCSFSFLLYSKVTQSHIHVYIFFSHYYAPS